MTTPQIISLIIAITALLGHIPNAVSALRALRSNTGARVASTPAGNAPQTPPSAP